MEMVLALTNWLLALTLREILPFFAFILGAIILLMFLINKYVRSTGKDEPVEGAVFITGCDSGMGEQTAFHLQKLGYHIFAGCYLTDSFAKFKDFANVTPIQLDVANEDSVKAAAEAVEKELQKAKGKISGLYGVLQCAGIAEIAPFEYFPMKAFKRQIDVNYFGYVYVAQAFLPIVKKSVLRPGARRGRFAFVSSGPLPGPGVPFITSYLGAKWAGEALCQGLRMEMRLRELPIDCVMVSPGIVKPTRLEAEGEANLIRSFEYMNQTHPQAKDEYFEMIQAFRKYQAEEKGTHVRYNVQQYKR